MLWTMLFLILNSESPAKHRFISSKEREFLMKNTKAVERGNKVKDYTLILHNALDLNREHLFI
jgi:hypothetical protein